MPHDAKKPASNERAPAAPGAKEQVQFNPQQRHAKSRGYLILNKRLRQQTLTQIDFVSYGPKEEPDLNLIEDGESLRDIVEDDQVREEQAIAKTTTVEPPTLPTTPRKKRKVEIPSSHSPPDSPFSPNNVEDLQGPKSPLIMKTEQLLFKSSSKPETVHGVQWYPASRVRSSVSWENDESQLSLASLLPSQNTSEDVGAGGSVARGHSEVQGTRFEEELDGGATISRVQDNLMPSETTLEMPINGVSRAVVRTEIRDSDDEGNSETDYDFGPETQAIVDDMGLTCLPKSPSEDRISSPPVVRKIESDLRTTIDYTDAGEAESVVDGTREKVRQVAFGEAFTTVKLHRTESDASPRTCGSSATHEAEDAQIQPILGMPKPDCGPFQSQSSVPLSGASTSTTSKAILRSSEIQPTLSVPTAHIESPPTSQPVDLETWVDDCTRTERISTGTYDFETASQLLPESLMNDSLPLPPDLPLGFFDEDLS
jgi:hypothetical protein